MFIHRTKKNYGRNKIKIAYIFNHSYFLGGGEISFFELIRKINIERFEPIAVVPNKGEIERKLLLNNIDVYIQSFPKIKNILIYSSLISLINIIKFLKKRKIQIIHANGSRVCFYAGIAGKILGIPIIWHVRETVQDIFWYDCFLGYLSSKIICVSKSVQKKRFEKFKKLLRKKIIVVYNGVDTEIFIKNISSRIQMRRGLGLNSQTLFGIIGNFVPLKGQDFFLKAFAEAKRREPNLQAKALFIGRPLDMVYYKSLVKLTGKLNIKSDIIYKNYRPDIKKLLTAIDVIALPSKREGFSRSMLEAMSCGLPIIGTKLSEIEEAIVDNKNGILVDFMNIEKMTLAIITLCQNKTLRKAFGALNRSIVERKFNLIFHVKLIESLYFSMIEKEIHYI